MKSFYLLIDLIIIVFTYIVPKDKKLYVFGGGDGVAFKGNPKYLYIYVALKRTDIKPLWITDNPEVHKTISAAGLPVSIKKSFRSIVALIRAKYIFIEITPKDVMFSGFTATGRMKYIQTFHGTPLKKIGNDANIDIKGISRVNTLKNKTLNILLSRLKSILKLKSLYQKYYLIVSSSIECTEKYLSAFDNKSVTMLGFPRNDVLFNKELNIFRNSTLGSIIKKKKVISYIPTFRDVPSAKVPFKQEEWKRLNKFLTENGYLFLIKKHPYEKNLKVPSGLSRIIDVSEEVEDVMDLLLVTDILVTDYSSVMFDFVLTGKPVVYYSYDYEEYLKSCRGMYYDYYRDISGPFAENADKLIKYIDTSDKWFYSGNYRKKYEAFVLRFNAYRDSGSSERLLKYLEGREI